MINVQTCTNIGALSRRPGKKNLVTKDKTLIAEKARLTILAGRCKDQAAALQRQAEHTRHPWERKAILDRARSAEFMAEEAETQRKALDAQPPTRNRGREGRIASK